jgi:hypothetical protein
VAIQHRGEQWHYAGVSGRPALGSVSGGGGVALAVEQGVGESAVTRPFRPLSPCHASAFAGYRFPSEVIVTVVRWYLRFRLSYRDAVELLAERRRLRGSRHDLPLGQRFTPLLMEAARPCRHAVDGGGWRYAARLREVAGED